jgi:hypothetical protein
MDSSIALKANDVSISNPLVSKIITSELPEQGLKEGMLTYDFPNLGYSSRQISTVRLNQSPKDRIVSKSKRFYNKYLMQLKVFPTFPES